MKIRILLLFVFLSSFAKAQVASPALLGYWQNWDDPTSPFIQLDQVDSRYNNVIVAFATPINGTEYQIGFTPYSVTQATFITQIQTLQSQGRKVIISIGGEGAPVSIANASQENTFISSLEGVINTYGFDGVDIDFEGSSISVSGGTIAAPVDVPIINLIAALKQVMQDYRNSHHKKLLLTMAPEAADVQGGMSAYGGVWGSQLPVINALRDSLDVLQVQLYNTGSMYGIDGGVYNESTADFIVAEAEACIQGFNTAGGMFVGLPASKVAIGLPSCSTAAGGGYTDTATVRLAMQYLMGKGTKPGSYTLHQTGGYPTLAGMMDWSINYDNMASCNNNSYAANFKNIFTTASVPESPYGGTAAAIPGTIQAENFDLGGQGVAYNDSDPANNGTQYRLTDGVDIEATTDAGGGYDVGWTAAGEWMQYTVNVTTAATYTLQARVSSILTGQTFIVTMDGVNISGTMTVPNTGAYQTWQTISVTTPALTTGSHKLRIVETTGGYNFNYLTFIANAAPVITSSSTSTATVGAAFAYTITASNIPASYKATGLPAGLSIDTTSGIISGTPTAAGISTITLSAKNAAGTGTQTLTLTSVVASVASPYGGSPWPIPGKIEAENYNNGGQGVGYSDSDPANNGGQYRNDGIDIESSGDEGYDIGWTVAGEWMSYTVNVTTAGYYTLQARVASNTGGGLLHVGLNNTNISGSVAVANTGGWQFWQTISLTTTYLPAGVQTLTIYTDVAGYNIDYLNFIGPVTSGLSVNITAPLNNVTYTAGSTIPITVATAEINALSKIQLYENNILLGQSTTSPYTFNWTNVPYGVYTITAKVTDNTNATTTSAPVTVTVNAVSSCPQPTWSDEFSGTSLDVTKWNYQTGNGCPGNCGWGNNELEYYTNTSNNISVSGGALAITAQYQPNYNGSGNNYTSGKLLTAGDFSQKYGHFEARVKAPSTAGAWPAFWMLPDNGNWPSTGEIDILECLNANPTTWYGTLHFANSGGSHLSLGTVKTTATPLSNDYHIYAAYWTTDSISWYIDDVLQGTVTKTALINAGGVWPFDAQNFYIILNFAVGGNFPGQTPDPTQFPVSMLVDYVRVYSGNSCSTCTYDTWTGAVSNAWENPVNWSCGIVPGTTTDVIINAVGTNTVIVNSNVTIRSLQLNPAVHITVNSGFHFTTNH